MLRKDHKKSKYFFQPASRILSPSGLQFLLASYIIFLQFDSIGLASEWERRDPFFHAFNEDAAHFRRGRIASLRCGITIAKVVFGTVRRMLPTKKHKPLTE